MLLLSAAALGTTLLAVLGGNLINGRTRGQFLPILITTELVAVVLAVVQTWLLRNLVGQDLERAFLLGSLVLLGLAGAFAGARFRRIRSHTNWAVTAVSGIAVLVLTGLAVAVVLLVYAFASSPNLFS